MWDLPLFESDTIREVFCGCVTLLIEIVKYARVFWWSVELFCGFITWVDTSDALQMTMSSSEDACVRTEDERKWKTMVLIKYWFKVYCCRFIRVGALFYKCVFIVFCVCVYNRYWQSYNWLFVWMDGLMRVIVLQQLIS